MATSGSTSFELTRDEIIQAALRKVGAIALGQTPSATEYINAAQALNSLIQLLHTDGMPLWKRVQTAVTLVNGTQTYTITDAVKVFQVILVNTGSDDQYELQHKSLYDFLGLPTTSGGVPVHWYGQPKVQDFTVGIWPTPDATTVSNYSLLVVSQKEFDGFTASGETPDFPPYWTDALIYHLAVRLAPEYGVPLADRQLLIKEADAYKAMATSYGDEDGSLFVQPNREG